MQDLLLSAGPSPQCRIFSAVQDLLRSAGSSPQCRTFSAVQDLLRSAGPSPQCRIFSAVQDLLHSAGASNSLAESEYRKNPKNSDILKICCNHPKTRLYHTVKLLNDADEIANRVDPDQTPLGAV